MNYPAISDAKLPATYEAARAALASCVQLDECLTWADKAAALGSYARQARDDELIKLSQRIVARAIRRAGELLKQLEPGHGANQNIKAGDHPNVLTRSDAAREAGMSPHQQKQAMRLGNIPEDEFNSQVDGPNPPTLSALAQQGIKPRPLVDLGGKSPAAYNAAMHFVGTMEYYIKDMEKKDLALCIEGLSDDRRADARNLIARIDAMHDKIMTRI